MKKRIHTVSAKEAIQGELFPRFDTTAIVSLQKEVISCIAAPHQIREKYPDCLPVILADGKTVEQRLKENEKQINELSGDDYAMLLKVFLFAQAIKKQVQEEPDTVDIFKEKEPGVYSFAIDADKRFYEYFEKPTGNKNGTLFFKDEQKKRIIGWLKKHQNTIELPYIITNPNGKEGITWGNVFFLKDLVVPSQKKAMLAFIINTNHLSNVYKRFVTFSRSEIDSIKTAWETKNPKYEKLSLRSFSDIPLRFLSVLKAIYPGYEKGGFQGKNNFEGVSQKLHRNKLNIGLGDLSEKIGKYLIGRDKIRTGKTSAAPGIIEGIIIKTTFEIATEQKWLLSTPVRENGVFTFNMNSGFFGRQETAKRLGNKRPLK